MWGYNPFPIATMQYSPRSGVTSSQISELVNHKPIIVKREDLPYHELTKDTDCSSLPKTNVSLPHGINLGLLNCQRGLYFDFADAIDPDRFSVSDYSAWVKSPSERTVNATYGGILQPDSEAIVRCALTDRTNTDTILLSLAGKRLSYGRVLQIDTMSMQPLVKAKK